MKSLVVTHEVLAEHGDVNEFGLFYCLLTAVGAAHNNLLLDVVHLLIELLPVWTLLPELISVVPKEDDGEDAEQHAPESTPEGYVC
jgi:hypothetical protein